MRLRLPGTPLKISATLAALPEVLEIHNISKPYPDRHTPLFQRIYIDATSRRDREESK